MGELTEAQRLALQRAAGLARSEAPQASTAPAAPALSEAQRRALDRASTLGAQRQAAPAALDVVERARLARETSLGRIAPMGEAAPGYLLSDEDRASPLADDMIAEGRDIMAELLTPEGQAARRARERRGIGQRIADNLLGLDDGVTSPGETAGQWLNRAVESATLGLVGDEANAAIDSRLGRIADGATATPSYEEALARRRGDEAAFAADYPVAAFGADLAGAVVPGTGIMQAGGGVLRGALTGAGAGGVYGFAEGEGGLENRATMGLATGLISGGIGGALPAVGGALRSVADTPAARRAIEAIPSVDDLKAAASELYERARRGGVTANAEATSSLASRATDLLREEGMILPSGGLVDGYPRVSGALSMLREFADQQMNPSQMLQVRRTLQAAAQSAEPAERRVGSMLIRQFDDFTAPLAPEIAEANALWRTASQGDLMDTTIELAGARAGQFSGSGFENALRTEFRALDRQVVKGNLSVSADERALIERIARGGSVENFMRDLGKLAWRGPVSGGITGSVGFGVGTALGGPLVGSALAAAGLGVGEVGRRVATRMQTANAELLSAVARNRGLMPQAAPTVAGRTVTQLEALSRGLAPVVSQDQAARLLRGR